jgi:excisionase family DNA binding protein
MTSRSEQSERPAFADLPDVLDVRTLAGYLGIGRSTAYALVRDRRVRTVRIGRRILIPKSSLVALLAPPNRSR